MSGLRQKPRRRPPSALHSAPRVRAQGQRRVHGALVQNRSPGQPQLRRRSRLVGEAGYRSRSHVTAALDFDPVHRMSARTTIGACDGRKAIALAGLGDLSSFLSHVSPGVSHQVRAGISGGDLGELVLEAAELQSTIYFAIWRSKAAAGHCLPGLLGGSRADGVIAPSNARRSGTAVRIETTLKLTGCPSGPVRLAKMNHRID